MSNFFNSLFKRNTPRFISGEKIIRPKTVKEVLGEAFDYKNTMTAQSFFCKKLLKFCCKGLSTENLLFILICEKYKSNPSVELYRHIYDEFTNDATTESFLTGGTPRQVNLSGPESLAINTKVATSQSFPVGPTDFDEAVKTIKATLDRDVIPRLIKEKFDTAFLLKTPEQQACFDDAINYLGSQKIILK